MSSNYHHISVLTTELMAHLPIKAGSAYLDCTCGGGGHSLAILQNVPNCRLIAIDQDQAALQATSDRLMEFTHQIQLWHGNFSKFKPPENINFMGIIADLGISSYQIDQSDRGFSFRHEASLDMRMDQNQELSASDIVNYWQERELADLIYQYGEERLSRRIARQIVNNRPIKTTTALADLIYHAVPYGYRHGAIHPATRTFQALRIAVNGELTALEQWLAQAPDWLMTEGRILVISFHSLEDRIVKQNFRQDSRLKAITKKPLTPTDAEIMVNPRARSAKLRVAEKIKTHQPK
jgi:16S rRNA (cytosine1402-N4)-methyltransferase